VLITTRVHSDSPEAANLASRNAQENPSLESFFQSYIVVLITTRVHSDSPEAANLASRNAQEIPLSNVSFIAILLC